MATTARHGHAKEISYYAVGQLDILALSSQVVVRNNLEVEACTEARLLSRDEYCADPVIGTEGFYGFPRIFQQIQVDRLDRRSVKQEQGNIRFAIDPYVFHHSHPLIIRQA